MNIPYLPKRRGFYYDPVEDTLKYKQVIQDIEKEIDNIMKDEFQGMGSSHRYWALKKKLFAERGIEWKSPAECNPNIHFD